jgi:HK97 family phage portal protein
VSVLFKRAKTEAREAAGWWNLAGIPGLISSAAYMGATSVDQALRNGASWACIDVLMDAIGRTPFDCIRVSGRPPVQIKTEVASPLLSNPSAVVLSDVWYGQLGWSLLTDGNGFGQITEFSPAGYPLSIELMNPYGLTDRRVVDGVPTVKVNMKDRQLYPHGDIWHVPGRMVPAGDVFGLSPISYAAKSIGTSLDAEQYAGSFFEGGGHPTALLTANAALTDTQVKELSDTVDRWARSKSRKTAVMGADLTWTKVQDSYGDTGVIEMMRFQVEQACRFWRVPPSMVYAAISGQNVTYANVTQADLAFLKHSLDGYFVRIESALSACHPRPQIVKANRNAILRADVGARMAVYNDRLTHKTMSVNEVRLLEDEAPFDDPEFDKPGIPGGLEKPAKPIAVTPPPEDPQGTAS